uniref:Fungal lipase-type domain-containing protein n=1 Tax=Chromera velia CCMP2878 TaxID=1169474 RepID=A0A0G4HTD2_9ALVE|eukprot:Cvel_8449.t1-p1 / transcript=Cvel_8449.t1 / gene=Cvel_8449 / organism=Chromera_velia_CCMP2878 / gene_product=hypothetical protein / transcript_product=hypothetical protein / location=Cvel_scaffold466:74215-75981(-) / protein_length=536 / sequence_SO=supercontig / SO=protein_coding / is_pseudo=false
MPTKTSVTALAVSTAVSLASGAPLLGRLLQNKSNTPVTADASLTVTPFSYPYPADGNVMGLQCNTETAFSPVASESENLQGTSLQSCLYETILRRENIPEAMCACMGVTTYLYDVCPDLKNAMGAFLCSQDQPFCERVKDTVGRDPEPVPFDADAPELELPFETPELPLPAEIKDFVSEAEKTTASLLWRANFRNYQLAQNYKCAEGRQTSYTDTEVLPGWKPERLFTPEYAEGTEEGHPWVSVSSRGKSLLVVVRGTEAFAEWVSDIDLEQVPSPLGMPGHLARGFSTVAGNVLGDLQKMITEETERVIVTGHSLGGYAGTIIAGGLQRHIEDKGLSTKLFGVLFASGRVGDAEWQEAMNKNTNVRFVQFQVDPVPYLVCEDQPNCGLPGSFDFSQIVSPTKTETVSAPDNAENERVADGGRKLSADSETGDGKLMSFADRTGVMTFSDYWLGTLSFVWGLAVNGDMRYFSAAHTCSYNCFSSEESENEGSSLSSSLCSKETCFDWIDHKSNKGNREVAPSFTAHLVAGAMKPQK